MGFKKTIIVYCVGHSASGDARGFERRVGRFILLVIVISIGLTEHRLDIRNDICSWAD